MGLTKKLRTNKSKFGESTTLIHGQYGCGKTLLSAQYPKPYFLMFENNNDYQNILHHDNITSWNQCAEIVQELLDGGHDFKTIVFDNIDRFCDIACQHYIKEYNAANPKKKINSLLDIGYGKAHETVENMIKIVLNPLVMDNRFGIIFISHTETRSIETFSGDTYDKLCPEIGFKRMRKYFFSEPANIFYYYFHDKVRYLKIVGDDTVMAKHRGIGHFMTKKGEAVINIPMKNSPQEAFKYLKGAYNNQLTNTYSHIK